MLSLVLTVLFVHIAIYLVNTIGASTIDALVCSVMSRLSRVGIGIGQPQDLVIRRGMASADSRSFQHLVMAPLPEDTDINLSKCARTAEKEA